MTVIAGIELDDLIALRDLDRAGVRGRFGQRRIDRDVGYEGVMAVDCLETDQPPMYFFFRGDDVAVLYVSQATLEGVAAEALVKELGPPAAELRSRGGRRSRFLVWPGRGVALSADLDVVEILEVFAPTSLEKYKDEIWRDPGEFIR